MLFYWLGVENTVPRAWEIKGRNLKSEELKLNRIASHASLLYRLLERLR